MTARVLRPPGIGHNGQNLCSCRGQIELVKHGSCVAHLGYRLGRDKAPRIQRIIANLQQQIQVGYFVLGRDKGLQTLHRIARTLNDLHALDPSVKSPNKTAAHQAAGIITAAVVFKLAEISVLDPER